MLVDKLCINQSKHTLRLPSNNIAYCNDIYLFKPQIINEVHLLSTNPDM